MYIHICFVEGVRNISNELSISTKIDRSSPNLAQEAKKLGLYKDEMGPFNFAKVFSESGRCLESQMSFRYRHGLKMLRELSASGEWHGGTILLPSEPCFLLFNNLKYSYLWSRTWSAGSFAVTALWNGTRSAVSFAVNRELKVNGQKLETVTSFKYLGSVITDEGSKPEILSRIAQTTAALTRLKPVWMTRVYLSAPRYD